MPHPQFPLASQISQVAGRIPSSASRFSLQPGKFGQSPQSLIVQTGPWPQLSPEGHGMSVAGALASIAESCPAGDATGPARTPKEDVLAQKSDC